MIPLGRELRRRSVAWGSWVLLATLLGTTASAQRYAVRVYTDRDGLDSSDTWAVQEALDGSLWVGHERGLQRYDSAEFRNQEEEVRLVVRNLAVDPAGGAWVVPGFLAVPVLAPVAGGGWEEVPAPAGVEPGDVWVPQPEFWVSPVAARRGGERALFCGATDGRLFRWRDGGGVAGGRWESVLLAGSPTSIALHGDRLLVADPSGVRALDPWAPELEVGPSLRAGVLGITLAEETGALWLVAEDGVLRVPAGGDLERDAEMVHRGPSLPRSEGFVPYRGVVDPTGTLTFGNELVLFALHPELGLERQTRHEGFPDDGVRDLALDREGHVWAATRRGLCRVTGRWFERFDGMSGLFGDEVTAILSCSDGRVVLGHEGGLTILAERPRTIRLVEGPCIERVLQLAETPDGTVWGAAETLGLARLRDGEVDWPFLFEEDPLVTAVSVDGEGALWIATRRGAWRLPPGQEDELVSMPWPTGTLYARSFLHDARGRTWVASNRGLLRHVEGTWTFVPAVDPRFLSCTALHERPGGELWVATGGGVCRLVREEGRVLLTPLEDPAVAEPVYFFAGGTRGETLWAGTGRGVLAIDGSRVTRYGVTEGMLGAETNRGAGVLDPDGRLLVGTDSGLSVLRPELGRPRLMSPTLGIERIEAQGMAPLVPPFPDPASEVRLPVGARGLTLELSSLSFSDERGLRFATWLEGYDDSWSPLRPLPGRRVSLAGLPAGRYRLHARAVAANGSESPEVVSPWLVVREGFWQSALGLGVGAGGLALVFAGLVVLISQRRLALRLEEEVVRREADIRTLEQDRARAHRLDALGVLAGGIAHDFNNLLTILLGNLSLLEESCEGERPRRLIHAAETASRRAQTLTRQLLTFSKGGAPVRSVGSIVEVLRESAGLVLAGKNVRVELSLGESLPPLEFDRGQMGQVFQNLLLNAVEAMPQGGTVRLAVQAESAPPPGLAGRPGPFVRIEVADEGEGIPLELQSKIFDPYFSTKQRGTGLGLSISYSVVERHGGVLEVVSSPGRGSTFRLWLPARASGAPGQEEDDVEAASLAGQRVLVLDDEVEVQRVYERMLERLGCEVDVASDGDQATRLYASAMERGRRHDVALFDLTIPGGKGGLEALEGVLALDREARVVVVSGYSDDPVLAEYREHGFCARLAKPFRTRELVAVLVGVVAPETEAPAPDA